MMAAVTIHPSPHMARSPRPRPRSPTGKCGARIAHDPHIFVDLSVLFPLLQSWIGYIRPLCQMPNASAFGIADGCLTNFLKCDDDPLQLTQYILLSRNLLLIFYP